jgi:hypothetical protein
MSQLYRSPWLATEIALPNNICDEHKYLSHSFYSFISFAECITFSGDVKNLLTRKLGNKNTLKA